MKQIIVFSLDSAKYCLNINEIDEIINYLETSKIPESPDFVEGLINLRGKVLAIINLKKILNLNLNSDIIEKKIIILNSKSNPIGIIVDDVKEIIKVYDDEFEISNDALENYDNKYICGLLKSDKENVFQLNLELVLSKTKVL
jgi:purine-binding chemotaxis protein CheW